MSTNPLVDKAKKAHLAGDLDTAAELYGRILTENPQDSDTNHLLGLVFYQQGGQEKALELIRKALQKRPEQPAMHNNLGSVLKEIDRDEEAIVAFERAIMLQPGFAEAYNNLGIVYKKLGRLDEAQEAFQQAITSSPEYIKALNNLGNIFYEKREYDQALNWYSRALAFDHDLPLTQYNLGCTLLKTGRLNEAEAALDKAVKGQGDMIEALNALGRLYRIQFKFSRSVTVLQQVIALQPESADGYISLGDTFMAMSRYGEAADYFEKAVDVAPDSSKACSSLGQVYRFLGRMEEAHSCLNKARKLCPDNAGILSNLAGLYIAEGSFAEAAALCREAISSQPGFSPPYCQLTQIVQGDDRDNLAEEISRLLDKEQVTLPQKMFLNFSLAKLFEDQEEYAKAFECLDIANRLKRRTFEFLIDKQVEVIDGICQVYRKEVMQGLAGKGYRSRVPVFIVGMPRSGTTLIEQILASHPDVYGAGELQLVGETLSDYLGISSTDEFVQPDTALEASDLVPLGRKYVERLQRLNPAARHISNKMPGNFMSLGLIKLILPQAKIIHCMRDPVDTCLSIYKKLFTYGHQYGYDLTELGEYYLLYLRVMEHWRQVMPGDFLDFSYEELVKNQEARTRILLEFVGLQWHDCCLDFQETKRPVHTASAVQVRQPLTDRSVSLWKQYEPLLKPLLSVLESQEDVFRQ